MAAQRPGFLVLVTQANGRLDLFSAHDTEHAAQIVFMRLATLLKMTGNRVHLVKVPDSDGIAAMDSAFELQASTVDNGGPVIPTQGGGPVIPTGRAPRRKTSAEFEEETRAMMDGATVIDTPDPGYVGAFS